MNLQARLYDPVIGRFLSVDPLAEIQLGITPYHYCGNDPVNAKDPSGLFLQNSSLNESDNGVRSSINNWKSEIQQKMLIISRESEQLSSEVYQSITLHRLMRKFCNDPNAYNKFMAVFPGAGAWTEAQVNYVLTSVVWAGGTKFLDHFIENNTTINMNFISSKEMIDFTGGESSAGAMKRECYDEELNFKSYNIWISNEIVENRIPDNWKRVIGGRVYNNETDYRFTNTDIILHEFGHVIVDMFSLNTPEFTYGYVFSIYSTNNDELLADEFVNAIRSHWNLPLSPNVNLRGEGVNGFQPNLKFWSFEYWR